MKKSFLKKLVSVERKVAFASEEQIREKIGPKEAKSLLDDYKPSENWIEQADPSLKPSPDYFETAYRNTDRNIQTLNNLSRLFNSGNLAGTGYISILPVDQGIEHSGIASFSPNPLYFRPENIVKLGIEAGTNAVASTFGVLSNVARSYAHKIPFIVKINHADLMLPGGKPQQLLYGNIKDAWNMGAAGIGATIYYGSEDSRTTIPQIAELFAQAHDLGMFTVLWCYLRNDNFKVTTGEGDKKKTTDYHTSADGSAQADHMGVTLKADIIKQKLPTNDFAFLNIPGFGKSSEVYKKAMENFKHPIDWTRVQVANAYNGWIPTINSGGESKGATDLAEALITGIVNKRAGGHGLILGRKAFQKPMKEGVELINWIQSVYLNQSIRP